MDAGASGEILRGKVSRSLRRPKFPLRLPLLGHAALVWGRACFAPPCGLGEIGGKGEKENQKEEARVNFALASSFRIFKTTYMLTFLNQ